MPRIESILCPVDFSEFSVNAYEYARSLAWHYKARLLLQHVLDSFLCHSTAYGGNTAAYEAVCHRFRVDRERELQTFARHHAHTAVRPECFVDDGAITDLILSLAETERVDMIVMGTHGWRGIDRLMLGSVTERVLRRARCPVLAVRKPAHHVINPVRDPEPIQLSKIVLCSDFSDHAHRASEYSLTLAKEYAAELTLVHVLEDLSGSQGFQSAINETKRKLCKSIPPDLRGATNVNLLVRIGKPYQQIIQLAIETQADLVVVGVRGRGALDTALFGSTTYRVIQLGPCPVLAVHI